MQKAKKMSKRQSKKANRVYIPRKPRLVKSGYISGRGDYRLGPANTMGKSFGNYLAGPIGGQIGGAVGKVVDQLGNMIAGKGDYRISKNTLVNGDPPKFVNTPSSGVRIRHREYITDLQSSIGFSNVANIYNLNPGIDTTFPWLASIAKNFQQYKFHGAIFEFISTCGSAISSTNNTLGEVIMATNYNAGDVAYTTKSQMLNDEFGVSVAPCNNIIHAIECDPKMTTIDKLYVRTGPVPANQDIRLYDLGLTQIAVSGQQQSNLSIGEIYISYDIEFFKTQLPPILDLAANSRAQLRRCSNVSPLGSGLDPVNFVVNDFDCVISGGNTIVIPATSTNIQNYAVTFLWTGTTPLSTSLSFIFTNASQATIWNGDTGTDAGNEGDSSDVLVSTFVLTVVDPALPVTIFVNSIVLPGGLSVNGDFMISVLADDFE